MTSLNHYNNLSFVTLHFPTTSASGSGESYCQSQETAIKDAKEELKTLESNKSDDSKKKIDALKSQIQKAEASKNDCAMTHNLPQEERNKGLEEVKQQRKIVEKLTEFTKTLENNNLLTHLCDGLQTFLGYDKTSKGYDGTGIVYSDLDRLCDGVMGFLSGVLGAVKDDDAVKTYDEYMNESDRLNKVLEEVNKKIGSGRNGLVASVDAVKRWLGKYFKIYINKTDFVTGHLGRLIGDLHSVSGKYYEEVTRMQGDELASQLTGWRSTVQNIQDDVDGIENYHVNILDDVLKMKIMHEVKSIKKSLKMLADSAKDQAFCAQLGEVDRSLVQQKQKIDRAINASSDGLRDTVVKEFGNIFTEIRNLNYMRNMRFDKIREIMKSMEDFHNKFDDNYTRRILTHFYDIKESLKYVDSENIASAGDGEDSKIRQDVYAIKSAVLNVGSELKEHVGSLVKWMDDVKSTIDEAKKKQVDALIKKQVAADNQAKISYIGHALQKKADEIDCVLKKAKAHLQSKIAEAKSKVTVIKGKALSRDDGGDVDGLGQNWNILRNQIKWLVADVHDEEGNSARSNYLGRIVKDLNTYANGVGERIDGVVDHLFERLTKKNDENSLLNGYITSYINTKDIKFNGNLNTTEAMEEAVKNAIQKEIKELVKNVNVDKPRAQNGAEANFKELYRYYDTVAQKLEESLSNAKKSVELADKIESDLREKPHGTLNPDPKPYLQGAIELALIAIPVISRQTANEIKSLMQNLKINDNVDGAIKSVTLIKSKLGKDKGDGRETGDKITKALTEVKPTFGELDSILTDIREFGLHTLETRLNEKAKGENSELYTLSNEIDKNLSLLTDKIAHTAQYIHRYLYDLKMKNIDVQLRKILDNLNNLYNGELSDQRGKIQNFVEGALEVIGELETAPSKVDAKRADTVHLIQTLKNDVFEKLNGMFHAVNDADETITQAISELHRAYDDAYSHIKLAVEALRKTLLDEVRKGFEAVTIEIKKLFSRQKLADLKALRSLVKTQSMIITCTINKDLNTGLKGFLKTLSGDHIDLYAAGHIERRPVNRQRKSNLLDEVKTAVGGGGHGEKVADVATKFKTYSDHIFDYLDKDLKQIFSPQPRVIGDYPSRISTIQGNLTALLTHISAEQHFDHRVPQMLETLKTSLTSFTSSHFGNASYPVLDAFPRSLVQFVGEMERVYVNGYDGGEGFNCNLVDAKYEISAYKKNETIFTLTDKGRKAAKIFLTIFNILHDDLDKLNYKSDGDWRSKRLCLNINGDDNTLGLFLNSCGYKVAEDRDSKDGELNFYTTGYSGQKIFEKLNETKLDSGEIAKHLKNCESNTDRKNNKFSLFDILNCLLSHVEMYNDVCHLSTLTARKQPCSVYEMLIWLSGLPHNPARQKQLDVSVLERFEELNEGSEDGLVSFVDDSQLSLAAYPHTITYHSVQAAVTEICSKAYDTVVCIAGTGDAQTVYGCDYCNNSFNFYYPQDGEGCLDMLLDVLRRLFPPLKFLQNQCKYRSKHLGWRDCQYGMAVPTGKSQCTEHSRDQVTGQPKSQPTCQAKSEVSCQPNSPLMSYLNDCLPGHLPHHLTRIGCKYECSNCPSTSKKGMPCMTPLGFRSFSGSIKTGKDICSVLDAFFSIRKVEALFTLLPKPPSSLPEHFGFALSLVGGWYEHSNKAKNAVQTAFEESIKNVSIQLVDKPNELTDAITNAYGSGYTKHSSCDHNHVKNLTTGDICKDDAANVDCAPYMSSLCADSYRYVAKAHSDTYLSWAVYLPWNFWTLLSNLYQEFCNIMCQDWGCRNCLNSRQCKRGQHGLTDEQTKKSHCKCDSMVKCKGVAPTFYRYGFSFGNIIALNGGKNKKQCSDFCTLLDNILKSKYFQNLFDKCDEFLFKIREPFIWLNVALWLLSLLYLLHIMVIRLDLLHIKSHLHSPSSHRIAAQSLLAAARVNKLNRVFYLQP